MKHSVKFVFGILFCIYLILPGCSLSTKGPVKTSWYESIPEIKPNLIVFLRGMGGASKCLFSPHDCFDKKGFVSAVRERNLPFDMVAPDLHFGYYRDRTFVDRLKKDIIQPAQNKGYKNIWLVGVSMGGLGSLFYLKAHPDDIEGVVMLGPFLGDDDILEQIIVAGGLDSWEPGAYDKEEQWQKDIWSFLKGYPHNDPQESPLFLGLGKDDYYQKGQSLLATYLPSDKVVKINGKHRFSTFYKLWELFLEKDILRTN